MTQNNLKVQKKGNKFKKKHNANKMHRVCFYCGNKRALHKTVQIQEFQQEK
jgi:ribosomal protein S14